MLDVCDGWCFRMNKGYHDKFNNVVELIITKTLVKFHQVGINIGLTVII